MLKATCYQQNKEDVNYKVNFLCNQKGQTKALIKSNVQLQAEAEGQMIEENFAVKWLAEEAWAIAAEQQVSALNLTASKGIN